MKENLMIQVIYPNYELPQEYKQVINEIDHSCIVSYLCKDKELWKNTDVMVLNDWESVGKYEMKDDSVCVIRTTKAEFFDKYSILMDVVAKVTRVNVVFTDIENFSNKDFEAYEKILLYLSEKIEKLYAEGKSPQLNLLTDRMVLKQMNNCGAGDTNITLSPDGKFYVCPAFYLAGDEDDYGLGKTKFSIGDLKNGLVMKTPQFYKLDYAPLCRRCDSYQCKRCVWLNRKTTYELNTPSHEQCVVAHVERNASRTLLNNIRKHGQFLPGNEIKEIDYLDPFDVRKEW